VTLLDSLQERGITLEAEGDRLRLRGPADLLTPELRQKLAVHKTEILAHLRRQQSVEALESRIRFARSEGALEAALERVQGAFAAGRLTAEETERLATLAAQEAGCLPEEAEEERLGDLLARRPMVRLRSRLLGEVVLLAADDAQVPADGALVVYRASELRHLVGRTPAQVQALHVVKVALDGQVVEG
jgi:hypothetical protein